MAASLGGYMLKTKFTVTVFAVFTLLLHGASDVATVPVRKGDSVTLHTYITINRQDRVKWYFMDTLIAHINGDLHNICTDVQCNKENERFRDRLKLDHQTGDLTITNINTSDADIYQLKIFRSSSRTGIGFDVLVHDAPAEIKRKSLMEGESVTLDTPKVRNPNDLMTWKYNGTLIAEITGDQTKICEDVRCKKRFRDRLKLDPQTGSLIITNTKTTDCGHYQLLTTSRRNHYSTTSIKSFTVSVTNSGLSSGVVAGICFVVVVLLVITAVTAGVIYYCRRSCRKESPHDRRGSQQDQREDRDAVYLL